MSTTQYTISILDRKQLRFRGFKTMCRLLFDLAEEVRVFFQEFFQNQVEPQKDFEFDGEIYALWADDEYRWKFLDTDGGFYWGNFDENTLPTDSVGRSHLKGGYYYFATFRYKIVDWNERMIDPTTFQIEDPEMDRLIEIMGYDDGNNLP